MMRSNLATTFQSDLDLVHNEVGDQWNDFQDGHVFVTGGTGFFGCWLLVTLIDAIERLGLRTDITVLTRDPVRFRRLHPNITSSQKLTFVRGSVESFEFFDKPVTHVIHAASELSGSVNTSPLNQLLNSVAGLNRVLMFAGQNKVRKFLLTSSGAVYGPSNANCVAVTENSPVTSRILTEATAYAESKRFAELACVLYGAEHNFEVKIARGFAFLGPFLGLDSHLAAANFFRAALRNEKKTIKGDGRTIRSYMYGADLSIWLWTIFVSGQSAQPYNVGSDEPISIKTLADTIDLLSPNPCGVEVLGKMDPSIPVDFYLPDTSFARETLGLRIHTTFQSAVEKTFNYFQERSENA